jgi:uncharacterized protein YggU (UPF0235/DUF167 family)
MSENQEIIWPRGIEEVVFGLIEKYGLQRFEDEVWKKIAESEDEDWEKFLSESPAHQLFVMVKKILQDGISNEEISRVLQEKFGMKKILAESLTTELKTAVINLLKRSHLEETSTKEKTSLKIDPYREPIE